MTKLEQFCLRISTISRKFCFEILTCTLSMDYVMQYPTHVGLKWGIWNSVRTSHSLIIQWANFRKWKRTNMQKFVLISKTPFFSNRQFSFAAHVQHSPNTHWWHTKPCSWMFQYIFTRKKCKKILFEQNKYLHMQFVEMETRVEWYSVRILPSMGFRCVHFVELTKFKLKVWNVSHETHAHPFFVGTLNLTGYGNEIILLAEHIFSSLEILQFYV